MPSPLVLELYDLVRSVPSGRCVAYGDLGASLSSPVSGYLVGRWMAACPADVPWWRVVAKEGHLPVHKRDTEIARHQIDLLTKEGVRFEDGRVDMASHGWVPDA